MLKLSIVFSFIISLISFPKSQNYEICPIYTCNQEIEKTTQNCFTVSRTSDLRLNYTFIDCEDEDTYCPFNFNTVYQTGDTLNCVAKSQLQTGLIHGQSCEEDIQCYSNQCKGKKCKGFEKGETCTGDEYCKAEYYCHRTQKICVEQIDPYDDERSNFSCTDDYECINSHVCYYGTCQRPYSLEDGVETNNSKMCKSGVTTNIATDNTGLNFQTVCDSFNLVEESLECAANQLTCRYRWNKKFTEFTQNCICSQTTTGKRYCPADHRQEFRNQEAFKLITLDKAHTLLRHISDWEGIHRERYYPNTEMDECVAKVLNSTMTMRAYSTLFLIFLFFVAFI